ncbi:TetR/AcrR family transcriptional regulator [Ramlibacter albus]|uniref:TetR/AcrR family transcriptional regulator n=1 Tax=Ramlibacter albus TaxID=2079448 RepID=A0A923S458_9BURK|nr:TetR/AcrR family transcriptional regulator [Ramlibacter albus]MBC5766568.1 TetR/AcrR family transcriptional regulator [Ramlibacter albus]
MVELVQEQQDSGVHQHRRRLLEGMAHAVAAKGYPDTTIADIVREAAVSRRTFYEHFNTKAECLIALYVASSHKGLKTLREAIDPSHEWQTQVETALTAYFGSMAESPVLMRTLFIEILGLGAEGLAARRRVNEEIADFILGVVNGPSGHPRKTPLSHDMAMAIVGGINELVLQYIEENKVGRLRELVEPASELVRSVTHAGE